MTQAGRQGELSTHCGVVGVCGGEGGSCLCGQLVQFRGGDALVHTSCDLLGDQDLRGGQRRELGEGI